MQSLRDIGSRYNDLQDAADELKAALRKCKNKQERGHLRQKLTDKKQELRRFKASLAGQELQAYKGVPQWNVAMAGTMIQLAPILLMYIFASGKIKTAMVGDRKIKI